MPSPRTVSASDEFAAHRALLFSIAYEILGSVADAEDVVQDSYLRWQAVEVGSVDNSRAYLAQIATRQALTLLRSRARQREDYVGTWLPEPLPTGPDGRRPDDGLDHVLTGEAVTTAMLLVLEALTPTQRAVFVLREVFDFGYAEIATAVGKSEVAVRKSVQRARQQVRERRRTAVASPAEAQGVADRFTRASETGDVQALMDVLAPDVVFLADGGPQGRAVRHPIRGQEAVARFLVTVLTNAAARGVVEFRPRSYNGLQAALVVIDGTADTVISLEIHRGLVSRVYVVRDPDKLTAVIM